MHIDSKPLVSVIIPTFNRCQFLKRAILSAVNQTFDNLEIFVINDGSIDGTLDVVDLIADKRIKYLCHEQNKGVVATRNTGVKNSTGEFITFLDDDDEWAPDKIAKQLEVFKNSNDRVGLVCTNGYSEYKKDCFVNQNNSSGVIYDHQKDDFFPLGVLIPPPSSWMLPKAVIDEIGSFDEKMRYHWDDGDYLVRLTRKYQIFLLNENLVIWHALEKHLETVSLTLIKDKEIFFTKNYDLMKKDKKYLFRFCRALGKDALSINKQIARKYLFKALVMRPWDFSIVSKIIRS